MTRGDTRDAVDAAFVRALERDRHREAVDGAKKRAALQRCDYNSFHQLVLGADLRAIRPRDPESGAKRDENRIVRDRGRVPVDDIPLSSSRVVNARLTASRSADEFIRVWRRGCGDDDVRKTELIFSVSADEFECAFKVSRIVSLAITLMTSAGGARIGLAEGLRPFDSRSSRERSPVDRSRRRHLVRTDALRPIRRARTISRRENVRSRASNPQPRGGRDAGDTRRVARVELVVVLGVSAFVRLKQRCATS